MLDTKIQKLKDHFGISTAADWCAVEPAWILSFDGCGPVTLDYLRLLLAARNLTLKNDKTPEYWQQHLDKARISHTLGNELLDGDDGQPAAKDRGIVCPFTIYIDTAEQYSFTFQGFFADASQGHRPLIVPTSHRSLGRHPDSLGDYSLSSGLGRCHVERKSIEDAHSTILGWDGRRERFESELANLARIEAGLVVVECSFSDLLSRVPARGKRSAAENSKILFRSILSFYQKYHVPWAWCDGRRLAEQTTFRFLEMWHRHNMEERKEEKKKLAKVDMEIGLPCVDAEIAAL